MCGIYGIIGNTNVIPETLTGIKDLEYRGYDSAGIAYVNNGFIKSIKTVGEIKELLNKANMVNPESNIAISHTRWATHGVPSVNNAHPHFSEDKNFCIVHNGIIENYLELKKEIGGKYYSETDSEVVAKLISKLYNGNMLETIKNVCEKLKGSYAIAIISTFEPDKIFVAKNVSPCVVGTGEIGSVVCSDINGIKNVDHCYVLKNNNFAVLTLQSVEIYNKNLEKVELKKIKVSNKNQTLSHKFNHYMLKEINEIPKSILNTIESYGKFDNFKKVLPTRLVKKTKNIIIVGCGTAYHAGLMGRKFFEEGLNINVKNEIASEFIYSNFKPSSNTLMVFVSQSGETADTLRALKIAKAYGIKTLAITNVKNSSICFEADYVIYTCAGVEIAVASTKAYVSQLTMFYLLTAYFKIVQNDLEEDLVMSECEKLKTIAEKIDVQKLNDVALSVAKEIEPSESLYMIGRGMDYITALESSLKLKEISYIHSEAYPSGELKHGTISLIDLNTFVFGFVNSLELMEKSLSNLNEVISRGGKVIIVSSYQIKLEKVYKTITIPKVADYYTPIVSIVLMQLIAYHTSVLKGINPDKPRSLAKAVTVE